MRKSWILYSVFSTSLWYLEQLSYTSVFYRLGLNCGWLIVYWLYWRSEEPYFVLLSLDVTYFVKMINFHLLFGITSSNFTSLMFLLCYKSKNDVAKVNFSLLLVFYLPNTPCNQCASLSECITAHLNHLLDEGMLEVLVLDGCLEVVELRIFQSLVFDR